MKRHCLPVFIFCCILLMQGFAMPPRDNVVVSQSEYDDMARLGVNVIKTPVRLPGMRGVVNGPGSVRPLVAGTMRFPVVAIDFPDFGNTNSVAQFDSMLFGTWASGSAVDYYTQVSYGQFHMTGVTSGWYTSDSNRAYYGYSQGFEAAARLVKEAAQKSDASTDYSQYDNDGDGYVDAFTCIHAGTGYEESGDGGDIWSHSWSLSDAGVGSYTTNDPWPGHSGQYIKIDAYTTDPERSSYSNHGGMVSVGVFCHEWGHALGLPDLYDTDGGGEGLGTWSLMSSGSWGGNNSSPYYPAHFDAWCKMELGWLNPTAVRRPGQFTLGQVETNAKAYWLMSRNRTFMEYFLVENRHKTMFDTLLWNEGLCIYHIDDSVTLTRWADGEVNAGGSGWKYGVALEQADGNDDLYNGNNRGDAGDPWPGSSGHTQFDSTTTPDTRTNYPDSPLYSGCWARDIPSASSSMACSLAAGAVGVFTGGPDASGYSWIDSDTTGGPAYGWNDIGGTGTLLGNGDDSRWSFSLPYNFNFYGTAYTTVWVCTNGWLSFGADPGTNNAANVDIPNTAAPNRAVFAFWDDLNVVAPDSGGVYYQNYGTSPNCSTVVMWKHARVKNSMDPVQNQVSFQVVLYEGGRVQVRYRDIWLSDTLHKWGRSASVGVENSAGTVGLQYLYNGSPTGNLLANERAIQFAQTSAHDVGATVITAPTGTIDSNQSVTPACTLYNYGNQTESYRVRFKVGSFYNDTARVSSHAPGTKVRVTFPALGAWPRGTFGVTCSTELAGDGTPANDKATGSVTVRVHDAACVSLLAPSGSVDSGTVVTPACSVANYGTVAESYRIRMKIGSFYNDTTRVTNQAAGTKVRVTFPQWTALIVGGPYAVTCSTELATDMKAGNDKASGSVTITRPSAHDVGATVITAPTGTIDSNQSVTPACTLYNYGNQTESYRVRFKVGSFYNDTARVSSHAPGTKVRVTFPALGAWPRGTFGVTCSTELAGDGNPANNRATDSVNVRVLDVGCSVLLAPSGTIDSGLAVTPACSLYNYGTGSQDYRVRMRIGSFYSDTAQVTGHAPGTALYVTFPQWSVTQIGGPYAVACSTELAGDAQAANDRQSGVVVVTRPLRDVGVVQIIQPVDTVDTGAAVVPTAAVRNFGEMEETFPVRFSIGSFYTVDTSVTISPGVTDTVSFPAWLVSEIGTHVVRCSTMLSGDQNNANDLAVDTVVVPSVGIGQPENNAVPLAFALYQSRPNPLGPGTTIRYALPRPAPVEVRIYDATGILVRRLVDGGQTAGYRGAYWNGCDDRGRRVAPGVYYCRFRAGEFRAAQKLVVQR